MQPHRLYYVLRVGEDDLFIPGAWVEPGLLAEKWKAEPPYASFILPAFRATEPVGTVHLVTGHPPLAQGAPPFGIVTSGTVKTAPWPVDSNSVVTSIGFLPATGQAPTAAQSQDFGRISHAEADPEGWLRYDGSWWDLRKYKADRPWETPRIIKDPFEPTRGMQFERRSIKVVYQLSWDQHMSKKDWRSLQDQIHELTEWLATPPADRSSDVSFKLGTRNH